MLIPVKINNQQRKNLIIMDGKLIPPSSLELSASIDDVTRKSPRRFLVSEC